MEFLCVDAQIAICEIPLSIPAPPVFHLVKSLGLGKGRTILPVLFNSLIKLTIKKIFAIILTCIGTNCSDSSDCCPDMNGDGVVNVNDLSGFLSVFGTSCQIEKS